LKFDFDSPAIHGREAEASLPLLRPTPRRGPQQDGESPGSPALKRRAIEYYRWRQIRESAGLSNPAMSERFFPGQ